MDQSPNPIEQEFSDLHPSCAVTRFMEKTALWTENQSDGDLTDSFMGHSLKMRVLIKVERYFKNWPNQSPTPVPNIKGKDGKHILTNNRIVYVKQTLQFFPKQVATKFICSIK